MKRLFSERMSQPRPRVLETLDANVRAAVLQMIQTRIANNAFGLAFPDQCPDNRGNSGTDERALQANMAVFHVVWPPTAIHMDHDELTDAQIFDLLEYSFEHVAKPVPRDFHSYFSHYHFDYDQPGGRQDLLMEVNRLFEHNGLAYELRDGQVERMAPTVLQQVLTHQAFSTGDATLDQLLTTARDKFLNRDLTIRREALEKLWDAWERLKSLRDPQDKRRSTQMLLDQSTPEPQMRDRIEAEARQLTEIGNNFFIRHTEVNKPPITESRHVDYLFHRLFSFLRMVLQAHNVQL